MNTKSGIREIILSILIVMYISLDLACDVTAHRYVSIFSLTFIGSALIYPLTYSVNDVVTEIFGYRHAKNLIWLGIFADFLFSFLIIGINTLPYPKFWQLHDSFIAVLNPMLRLNIGGLCGILAGRLMNIYLLSKLKIATHGKLFWLRNIFSSAIGICVHSFILDIITFYHVVPAHIFFSIMLTNYLTNLSSVLMLFWIPTIIVKIIKAKYHIDQFDNQISYNPLPFK